MDDQAAKVLSYLDYAIESLTTEREYFRTKAKDPFVSSADRVRAMAVFTQLDAQITELVERRDALLAGYRKGTIAPPSSASSPLIRRNSVVLPAPFRPTRPTL